MLSRIYDLYYSSGDLVKEHTLLQECRPKGQRNRAETAPELLTERVYTIRKCKSSRVALVLKQWKENSPFWLPRLAYRSMQADCGGGATCGLLVAFSVKGRL